MSHDTEKLSAADKQEEKELLIVCKQHQGEYRFAHHGSGSWATTYSKDFIRAAANLYLLYKRNDLWPITCMSRIFQEEGVRSCRGSIMTYARIEYLYNTHLQEIISEKSK